MALLPLLDIARGGLLAQELALSVTGNNIANVGTPGYSRERADLVQEVPAPYGGVVLGRGVRVGGIDRIVDPLVERRARGLAADAAEEGARRDQLRRLAALANDVEAPSLASDLDAFFDAAEALARTPAGVPERLTLLGRAGAVADAINRRAQQLGTLERASDDRMALLVAEGNGEIQRVAQLNVAIANAELGGQTAAPLRDERERALESLAAKVGIDVVEGPRGTMRVSLRNGTVLVEGHDVVHRLAAQPGSTAGLDGAPLRDLGVRTDDGRFVAPPGAYASGELAGLRAVRDGELVQAAGRLDTFASTFAAAVNGVQQHAAALDANGNATAGVPLFTGTTAATLALAISDPALIAAARSAQPGDAANALALADLRAAVQPGLGNVPLTTWLSAEQARVGQAASLADDVATAAELLAAQVRAEREAVSGVNLNEELTNLVRFQHAFQASAKLIGVADGILDELVNLLG